MGQQIIIYGMNFTEEEEFTFNNFDELKGYLKGKTIYINSTEQHNEVRNILGLLGFRHCKKLVTLGKLLTESSERIITVSNDTFEVDFAKDYMDSDISGEDLIEDYNILKMNLIFAIIPWPITCEEAKEMTVLKLGKMNVFFTDMLKRLEELNFSDGELAIFIDEKVIDRAKEFIENYTIQLDNLKYIW